MKKIISIVLILMLCLTSMAFASDAQRKLSSGLLTSSQSIKTSAGKIYGMTIIATQANGQGVLIDSSSSTITGKKVLMEITEATQYDSESERDQEGINAYEGIFLDLCNAKAIIYYY